MKQYYKISKPIKISDDDMKLLEWLHIYVRNPYEHFVPKSSHGSLKSDLIQASLLGCEIAKWLIFSSGYVWHPEKGPELANNFRNVIDKMIQYCKILEDNKN